MIWPTLIAAPLCAIPGGAVPLLEISLSVIVPGLSLTGSREKLGEGMCHGKYCLWYFTGLCLMGWRQRRNLARQSQRTFCLHEIITALETFSISETSAELEMRNNTRIKHFSIAGVNLKFNHYASLFQAVQLYF